MVFRGVKSKAPDKPHGPVAGFSMRDKSGALAL